MTNEEILEKQVEALEKLLQLRSAIIEELEAKVNKLEAEKYNTIPNSYPGVPGWVTTPYIGSPVPSQPFIGGGGMITISNTCPDGSLHSYGGSSGHTCTKCGAYRNTVTSISTSGFAQAIDSLTGDVSAADTTNIFTLTNVAK